RASLLSAADGTARRGRDDPGVIRVLQHAGRRGRAGASGPECARGLHVTAIGELYRDVILDHYRHPRNFRALENARRAEGHNPLCGDRFTVFVRVTRNAVDDVSFQGSGCAIATASASLMTERLHRCTVSAADGIRVRLEQMISGRADTPVEDLGDL